MKTKFKLLSIFAVFLLTLFACQNADNTGQEDLTGAGNRAPDGYNDNTGDGMTNVRNNTMERDADRFQNRDNTRNIGNRNNQYDVSEEAAERITEEVDGVSGVQVLTTDNNAYVAATLDTDNNEQNQGTNRNNGNHDNNRNNGNNGNNGMGEDELTEEVKDEIGDIVRSVDNNIDNVYVSTNPDFVDLTNNYVDDMNAGRPVEGFFDQIGNMVQRIFPQNR
ncbi:YhcN/YlaJ family sporulation lipoprotein [Oceanobacillus damuensis]|uniref:YhcN/YlaJ family sporulation lipoprotein n=1 Tax=Oceanobacillus damuensis TaxID=937928 RepID=UPI00083119C6|nr:YhcN/YlaJ family sporulation lipoprotein [Oceanobacillus damuensis]